MRRCLAWCLVVLLAAPVAPAIAVDWESIRDKAVPMLLQQKQASPPADAPPQQDHISCLGNAVTALPKEATVIECQPVSGTDASRSLVLWMVSPEKKPEHDPEQVWPCTTYSRGNHYTGPTRVSLLDPDAGDLLNTMEMYDPIEDVDTFDIPYHIPDRTSDAGAFTYHVPNPSGPHKAGKPRILDLVDLNGDDMAHEFYLAVTENCALTMYAVFGLNADTSRLVQHEVDLRIFEHGEATKDTFGWLDNWPLFGAAKGETPGVFTWQVDLRGRGGCLDSYDVRWSDARQEFLGALRAGECAE